MTKFSSTDSRMRSDMALQLSQLIIGMRDAEQRGPNADMASGRVEVDIHMQSMVRTLVHSIWMDAGQLAASAEAAVREATSKVSIVEVVRDIVARQVNEVTRDLETKIAKRINEVVESAIAVAIGHDLRAVARAAAEKVWAKAKK